MPQPQIHTQAHATETLVDGRAFDFVKMNRRERKPRTRGLTEIRGPYYTPMGRRYLEDVLETMGEYVDALKFAGGSFALMPRARVKELLDSSACARASGAPRASGDGS